MTLGFILLGLLIGKPMTGYDLKTFFDNSVNFFWSAELSQIYRELSRLEKQRYVVGRMEQQEGRPNKKIYDVTEAGSEVFNKWLGEYPENLTPVSRNEFLVRIFFSSKLSKEELIYQLKRYILQLEKETEIYRSIEQRIDASISTGDCSPDILCRRFTVRRGIYFNQSETEWASECIEELNKLARQGK